MIHREVSEAGARGMRKYGTGVARNAKGRFTKGVNSRYVDKVEGKNHTAHIIDFGSAFGVEVVRKKDMQVVWEVDGISVESMAKQVARGALKEVEGKVKNAVNWIDPHTDQETIYYEGWNITVAKRKKDSKWSWEVSGEDNTGCSSKSEAIRQAKDMVDRINR